MVFIDSYIARLFGVSVYPDWLSAGLSLAGDLLDFCVQAHYDTRRWFRIAFRHSLCKLLEFETTLNMDCTRLGFIGDTCKKCTKFLGSSMECFDLFQLSNSCKMKPNNRRQLR